MIRAVAPLVCLLALAAAAQQMPPRPPAQPVPQGWPIEDCNGNGVPDLTDIYKGTSRDCNLDRIPDECQVALPYTYIYPGDLTAGIGTVQDYICWLTNFDVVAGHETVTGLEVTWGLLPTAQQVTLAIWSDPDGDRNPTDAQLIHSQPATSKTSWQTSTFALPDVYIGPAGSSFFVGVYGQFPQTPSAYPAGISFLSTVHRSWFINGPTPIQPNNLPAGMVEFDLIGNLCSGCAGDWSLKLLACATGHCGESKDLPGNGIPDECEPDCNGNGIPDDWDIQQGYSSDCDGDLVPDDCQNLEDCDANGNADLCQVLTPFGLAGAYYANEELSGKPLGRIDPQVKFDFVKNPPFPGIFPTDHFSVRWSGSIVAPVTGTYTFALRHDDGVRLWVDGWPVIKKWQVTSPIVSTGTVDLLAGVQYYLRLEYFDKTGGSVAELSWQQPGGSMNIMQPYELAPLYDRDQDGIPDTCQVTSDCNGNGLEDAQDIALGRSTDCNQDGLPDECQPELDCDENGVLDSCELALGNGLIGQYWISQGDGDLFERFAVRLDPNIDFDWAGGSPLSGFPADHFVVRWTGSFEPLPSSGSYTLYVKADDGVRVWIDGALVIDEWHFSTGKWYSKSFNWQGGQRHLIQLDYFESGQDARVFLQWKPPGGTQVPIPQSALRPDTDLNGDGRPDFCS